MKTRTLYQNVFFSFITMVVLCLMANAAFCQPVTIVSPVTNQTYKLPDPGVLQTAADMQAAIALAESTGKTLNAEATTEKGKATAALNENAKGYTAQNDYATAINKFNTDDVSPYKADLDKYTALGTKFNVSLTAYNKAATANNALPAKNRSAATVAALTKQKVQIDTMGAQLTRWKTKLDAVKAKLDIKNAALQKQQKTYQTAQETSAVKLKAIKPVLNNFLTQLTQCANYEAKCHGLLVSKFNKGAKADSSYFSTPAYRSSATDLYSYLVKLKNY
jgi:hypothetical protein